MGHQKRARSEYLSSFPAAVAVEEGLMSKLPGIQRNVSNLSESTGGSTQNAFMAYEKYADLDGAESIQSQTSKVSFSSQDTFSTSPVKRSKNDVGGRILPAKVKRWFCWHLKWAESIVRSRTFKRLSIILIVINCIICALATADFVTEKGQRLRNFNTVKQMFAFLMTIELIFQFLANGLRLFTDGWLVFDLLVISFSWTFENFLVMRTFRVVRTLRLASWIKDLKELVRALLMAIPKMFAIFFLLLVLFFVFSILLVDMFKYSYSEGMTSHDYFGSLHAAFFTLFQIMTLDNWSIICKELMVINPWAWAPIIGFVIVSSFFFLNLVIAVVCDAVTSVHRETVVKYLKEDISAATSIKDALKIEERLEEMAGSIQLLMQAHITLLESMQQAQLHPPLLGEAQSNVEKSTQDRIQLQKEALAQELNASFYGKVVNTTAKSTDNIAFDKNHYTSRVRSPAKNAVSNKQRTESHDPTSVPQIDVTSYVDCQKAGLNEFQISKVVAAIDAASGRSTQVPHRHASLELQKEGP